MQSRIASSLLSLVLLAAPALAAAGKPPVSMHGPTRGQTGTLASTESRLLKAMDDSSLGQLRAGASTHMSSIQGAERATLTAAAARASDLSTLRAGDLTLTNHDLQLIAIVAAIVLILVII